MISYSEWLKIRETGAGAGGVYVPGIDIMGSWQGAPKGHPEPLSSVGDVKLKKKRKKKYTNESLGATSR